jgi:hypothetical protein
MSATRKFHADYLYSKMTRKCRPYWLEVDGKALRVNTKEALWLACQVAALVHDDLACNAVEDTDSESEHTRIVEARVKAHMEAESSDEEIADAD